MDANDMIGNGASVWGITPLEYEAYQLRLGEIAKEIQDKEERYRFYEWFFELTNAQTREELEQLYGEELPDGINSI